MGPGCDLEIPCYPDSVIVGLLERSEDGAEALLKLLVARSEREEAVALERIASVLGAIRAEGGATWLKAGWRCARMPFR